MNPDAVYAKNPEVVARDLAENEGGVLLHLQSGAYFGINRVGLLIWEMIDGQRPAAALVEGLRDRLRNGPPGLDADVATFLASALERDLINLRT